MRSFEKDGSITNPIKLEACVENATNGGYPKIQEPIHILIANLVKVVKVAQSTNVSTVTKETMSRFDTNMKSFVHRLSRASLEDFELDKTASFDQGTHIGLRNTQYAILILGCYEVREKQNSFTRHTTKTKTDACTYIDCNGIRIYSKWCYSRVK